jgi:MEDS: MEthanogen/methylotroph, DcmR Sensory domain
MLSSLEVEATLRELTPGTHAVLIYDSPENKHEVAFNHLRYGVEDAELAYVCSEEKPTEIRQEMKDFGMDVDALERKKQLNVATYESVYFNRGHVYIPSIIAHFSKSASKAARQGLKGLRAVGEMSCFIRHNKIDEMMDYEQALQRRFSFPAMGLCAYNVLEMASTGNIDTLMPVLRAHGTIILTGPKGSAVLKPDVVQKQDVEQVMKVRI